MAAASASSVSCSCAAHAAYQAADLAAVLRARMAVPIHYRYTAGPVRDRLLLKYDGTPEQFTAALAATAPATPAIILEPGQPLTIEATAPDSPKATPR